MINPKFYILFFVFIFQFFVTDVASSLSGYDQCGSVKVSNLIVRPQGDTCYNNCDVNCQTNYSVKDSSQLELNDDIISLCNMYCKSNISLTSPKRQNSLKPFTNDPMIYFSAAQGALKPTNSKGLYNLFNNPGQYNYTITSLFNTLSSPIVFNSSCDITNTAKDSTAPVKSGQTITISLHTPADATNPNQVALCGHDIRKTDPAFNPYLLDSNYANYTYSYPSSYNMNSTYYPSLNTNNNLTSGYNQYYRTLLQKGELQNYNWPFKDQPSIYPKQLFINLP